jgi:tetratricopeptide (TPR) repeat protein
MLILHTSSELTSMMDLGAASRYDCARWDLEEQSMVRLSKSIKVLSAAMMAVFGAAVVLTTPAGAIPSTPSKPKIDCTKKANKQKAACQTGRSGLTDDELYNAAYWLARQGSYQDALALLKDAQNQNDPRVLNATGYATRKLGDVDAALPYYAKALALDPNYTKAREYLGEAHLAKGDLVEAQVQLNEIETRCGKTCSGYAELANEIENFTKNTHHDG